jgi:tRNA-splicing ligase RtcB (3'-phosphate/5'-hydroxy nucleic acid ligase)
VHTIQMTEGWGIFKVHANLWLNDVEEGAMEQIAHLCNLPFAFHHVAIMPDCHQGYGMPVGGVLATKGVIIPNAVGVDIGCGMCAVKTPWTVEQINPFIKNIMGEIRKAVPVGFSHHKIAKDKALMPQLPVDVAGRMPVVLKEYNSACKQLGTLGGGNHFIEIQKDPEQNVWIMLHSGSRNIGKQVADYYNRLAIDLNEQWHSGIPKKWELAFLPLDTNYGNNYWSEMQYCVDFALANRKLMMDTIANIFNDNIKWKAITISEMINIAHNYAAMENHFGSNVMVHRKGATRARTGEMGIIPGSQGTNSYIVKGKGNEDSFQSCSHGAGRKLSRTKAQNELDLATEIKKLDDQGIIHGIRHKNDLDEASGAYKDINEVMNNQSDLVEIVTKLSPIAVIKG